MWSCELEIVHRDYRQALVDVATIEKRLDEKLAAQRRPFEKIGVTILPSNKRQN